MAAFAERITNLLRRYADDQATETEVGELLDLLQQPGADTELENFVVRLKEETSTKDKTENDVDWERIWNTIQQRSATGKVRTMYWRRLTAVAAIFLLSLGAYFVFFYKAGKKSNDIVNIPTAQDIKAPQTNKARITLADGQQIAVDSLNNYLQGNVKITKTKDGKIIYEGSQPAANNPQLSYNTLTNPRGSKVIDMQLSDGSHVWLNAGSSVTYPIAFIGNERKVSITGEAYFEVAKSVTASGAKQPFFVSKGETQVQVLGTHFNVNAYDDEADIKITLLEGSVKVSNSNDAVTIKPGQQAVTIQNSKFKIQNNIDLSEVMAWKNGMFSFKGTDIRSLMRQIARWYDVEVIYEGNVSNETISGDISREANISKVMKMLEYAGMHFKIEGKVVTVIK